MGKSLKDFFKELNILAKKYSEVREIKSIEDWNPSPEDWENDASFCSDCLINLNFEAGNKKNSSWKSYLAFYPMRSPEDTKDVYVLQALENASETLQTLERPEEISEEDFERAIKKASNEIISALAEVDKLPPDKIFELAGKEIPKERAASMPELYDYLFWDLWSVEGMEYAWFNDLYLDEETGQVFAIVSMEGKIYKSPIVWDSEQRKFVYGEFSEVIVKFVEQQSKITVTRQADGKYRWFAFPACTAVINRNGEIDSTIAFDKMVNHAKETGDYPYFTIFHLGRDFQIGQADFLERDGYLLLMSGTFEDTKLANAARKSIEEDTENYWGLSIGFSYNSLPTMLEIQNGIKVPIYENGDFVCIEGSLLPEKDACSLLTSTTAEKARSKYLEVNRKMDERIKDALEKIVGGDEELMSDLESKVDSKNRTIEEENMIRREGAKEKDTEAESENSESTDESSEKPKDEENPEIVLSDEDVINIGLALLETSSFKEKLLEIFKSDPDISGLANFEKRLQEVSLQNSKKVIEIEKRLDAVEISEDQRIQEISQDMPSRSKTIVSYRPRHKNDTEGDTEETGVSYEEKANRTLEMFS